MGAAKSCRHFGHLGNGFPSPATLGSRALPPCQRIRWY